MTRFLQDTLTPEELYWAGLIHADGTIERAKLRIKLAQVERYMIEEFLKFLDQDTTVTVYDRVTNYGPCVYYYATSGLKHRPAAQRLLDLGVKTEPKPELYASRHFWRGLIDGDGSVSINANGYAVIRLSSGKHRDAEAFSTWIGDLFGCRGPKPCQGTKLGVKSGWYVGLGGGKARALGAYLYENSYSALPRKQVTALTFRSLETRTKVNLLLQTD